MASYKDGRTTAFSVFSFFSLLKRTKKESCAVSVQRHFTARSETRPPRGASIIAAGSLEGRGDERGFLAARWGFFGGSGDSGEGWGVRAPRGGALWGGGGGRSRGEEKDLTFFFLSLPFTTPCPVFRASFGARLDFSAASFPDLIFAAVPVLISFPRSFFFGASGADAAAHISRNSFFLLTFVSLPTGKKKKKKKETGAAFLFTFFSPFLSLFQRPQLFLSSAR